MEKIKVFLGDSRVVFWERIHFFLEEDVEAVGKRRTSEINEILAQVLWVINFNAP